MIEVRGLTDPGRKRKNNEDALWFDPAAGLVVVADGMGGHQSGEVASILAVETVADFVVRAQGGGDATWPFGAAAERTFEVNCLSTGIKLANRRVFSEAGARPELAGMGTTVVAALVRNARLTYAGVGDSRAYLLRRGALRQLTRDDSWLEAALSQQLITESERHGHPFRNVLTKAVGLQAELEFEVHEEPLEDGDRILLCSDGLTSVVLDAEISSLLATFGDDLEGACRALIAAANEAGGPDNVTATLLRVRA